MVSQSKITITKGPLIRSNFFKKIRGWIDFKDLSLIKKFRACFSVDLRKIYFSRYFQEMNPNALQEQEPSNSNKDIVIRSIHNFDKNNSYFFKS